MTNPFRALTPGREPVLWAVLTPIVVAAAAKRGLELDADQVNVALSVVAVILGWLARQRVSPTQTPLE